MTGGQQGIEHVEIAAGAWQLRPPSGLEAADALAMLQDPLTVRWNPAPKVVDLASAREWCQRGADWSDGTHATLSILDATTGRLAGQRLALAGRPRRPAQRLDRLPDGAVGPRPGCRVARRSAPCRAGRSARSASSGSSCRTPSPTSASCRVAEKSGYLLEGVLRQAFRAEDGTRHDEHLHARLAGDGPD